MFVIVEGLGNFAFFRLDRRRLYRFTVELHGKWHFPTSQRGSWPLFPKTGLLWNVWLAGKWTTVIDRTPCLRYEEVTSFWLEIDVRRKLLRRLIRGRPTAGQRNHSFSKNGAVAGYTIVCHNMRYNMHEGNQCVRRVIALFQRYLHVRWSRISVKMLKILSPISCHAFITWSRVGDFLIQAWRDMPTLPLVSVTTWRVIEIVSLRRWHDQHCLSGQKIRWLLKQPSVNSHAMSWQCMSQRSREYSVFHL